MENRKKFGAFAGVFTPSILTILGVIMYMRLGWVVGQAGLIGTLLIILLAHVVSVTTGLSISSIATDKQVKEGGIYYMLSRSLGLPMGGAIGLALFVATALGISLYIVGFTENFLGIPAIREFLGLGTGINDIRIAGTAVVIVLTILGLISTSLVIKAQYFILGAIALSLISVFVGFLWQPESNPETILMFPASDSLPMAAVFAVFFPAVTGFTAGVAMSGDLKNARKDIPRGTIAAIITGLVVYVSLTLVMAFFMPRDILLNDKNFLMKSAWIGGLVVAGIWGATLSSALGGILGGPRIMQAIALDKILPRFLAKGHGENKEPRNALILTFIIAEAGILIGDLNAIAELVSMFYLTSYGFINLAYVLEGWASSDFRPSLRIPHWVGLAGFIATFAIMFQLNPLAMIISLVLMLGIYFLLKRKEIQLDFGDVWQSVWSSMVRSSLYRMDRKGLEDRNWRPNIILFSGGTKNRPHLIEFGKALVGKHGLLSNFDLVVSDNPNSEVLPKHQQPESNRDPDLATEGIFSRRHTCRNVYEGIENISQNYGFSGVEPNTVLMGWARQTEEPAKFVEMMKTLHRLDMNILMIDYDKRKGFGNYKTIDIWWRGGANNSHLAIQLVKFLWLSEKWQNARLRLMIINPINSQKEIIHKETQEFLDSMRIKAEIKIINNEIEGKPLYDIIRVESINSDLIFLGLPFIEEGKEENYINNINGLCKDIGTVILVRASSRIKPIELKADIRPIQQSRVSNRVARVVNLSMDVPDLKLPQNRKLADELENTKDDLVKATNRVKTDALIKLYEEHEQVLHNIKKAIHDTARKVSQVQSEVNSYERAKKLLKIKQNMLTAIGNELIKLRDQQLKNQKSLIEKTIAGLIEETMQIINRQPSSIRIPLSNEDLEIREGDSLKIKIFKSRKKLTHRLLGKKPSTHVYYRSLLQEQFPLTTHKLLNVTMEKWGIITAQFIVELQKTIEKLDSSFKGFINKEVQEDTDDEKLRMQLLKDALESINNLSQSQRQSVENLLPEAQKMSIQALQHVSDGLDPVYGYKGNDDEFDDNQKLIKRTTKWLAGLPEKWQKNQSLLLNAALLETYLLTFSTRIQTIFNDISYETEIKLSKHAEKNQQKVLDQVKDLLMHKPEEDLSLEEEIAFEPDTTYYTFFRTVLDSATKRIRLGSRIFPANINLMSDDSFNEFHNRQFSRIYTVKLSVTHFLDYLIQNELIAPLQTLTKKLPDDISRNNKAIREIVRVLDFTLSEKQKQLSEEQLTDFIYKQSQDIQNVLEQTRISHNEALLQLKERVSTFSDNLQYPVFRHKAFHSRQYIRTSEKEKTTKRIHKQLGKFWNKLLLNISKIYYRRSRGILLAQQLRQKLDQNQARVEDLLNIMEASSGSSEVINSLPFYYRQLFLRRQNYLMDFWVGRASQMEQAELALRRYHSGHKGGMLILGERYSGKTFMAQYIVNKLLYKSNLIIITPPHAGSTSRNDFKQALIAATDKTGDYDEIFNDLPQNSVILFEDMDLWWEKTANGMEIIHLIMKLIRKHSQNYMFLLTIDKHAFKLINQMHKIESHFLSLIDCEPMNAEELRKAIMLRHESGNVRFRMGNRSEKQLRPWSQARLFSRYFSYSRGNVGVALQTWINNIKSFNNGVIDIKEPKIPDLGKLNYLETHWYLTLAQILLHRRVTAEKLSRLMRIGEHKAIEQLEILFLSGILVENGKNVYEINPMLYPHLMTKLNEMKII